MEKRILRLREMQVRQYLAISMSLLSSKITDRFHMAK